MDISAEELEAFLDEALPADVMARIEQQLRGDAELARRLRALSGTHSGTGHTLGAIWRRHRLTCPTRQTWGSFLLGTLSAGENDYLKFHVEVLGCRVCQANVDDLRNQQAEQAEAASSRRRKYFQSSAGYLHHK